VGGCLIDQPRLVIFTGAPGAGKTTVLEQLRARGHAVMPEGARQLIRERSEKGLSPRPPAEDFARAILQRDIESYSVAVGREAPLTFFDRAIPDALAMLEEAGQLVDEEREATLARYPYHGQVFLFPPWEAIYEQDAERDQSFADATRVSDLLEAWYRRCGYEVARMPEGSVNARCEFVLQTLGVT